MNCCVYKIKSDSLLNSLNSKYNKKHDGKSKTLMQ